MKALVATCCVLAAAEACAGWDTNIWPAYAHTRSGRLQAEQCYSGLVERCEIRGVANPTRPALWPFRSVRSFVVNMKSKMKSILYDNYQPAVATWQHHRFVNTALTNASGNYVDALGTDFSLDGREVFGIGLTVDAICSNACLPTNFFDYTPLRCLSGLGPYTNDTTVGRAHGWENATTAAGGSYFPGSRTNWYTTDYGLDGLKAAINELDAIFWKCGMNLTAEEEGTFNFYLSTLTTNEIQGYAGDIDATWNEAKTEEESDYGYSTGSDVGWVSSARPFKYAEGFYNAKPTYTNYLAFLWAQCSQLAVTNLDTNVSHRVEMYHYSTTKPAGDGAWGTIAYQDYSAQGDGFSNGWNVVTNWTWSLTNFLASALLGSANMPTTWCIEPTAGTNKTARGYYNEASAALIWYDFEYND